MRSAFDASRRSLLFLARLTTVILRRIVCLTAHNGRVRFRFRLPRERPANEEAHQSVSR
jgi:hypothetical protein